MTMRLFQPHCLQPPRQLTRPRLVYPVCLEIGAGMGRHAMQFARQNPGETLIAIERTRAKFRLFATRLQAHELGNLHAVHADAVPWIVHVLPAQSVSRLFILYPNPEPKNAAQRWVNMPFFEFLLSRLQPQASILLASNVSRYLDEAALQLTQRWQLPFTRSQVPPESMRTHFEQKYLARGECCEQLTIVKPAGYHTRFDHYQPAGLQGQ